MRFSSVASAAFSSYIAESISISEEICSSDLLRVSANKHLRNILILRFRFSLSACFLRSSSFSSSFYFSVKWSLSNLSRYNILCAYER
jgi:hypothetical protein